MDLKSVQWLWRNLPLSGIRYGISSTADHDFLSLHVIGTNPIPLHSRRRAQQAPANRIGIHPAVVEKSAIKLNPLWY